jgi:hypothetical protein
MRSEPGAFEMLQKWRQTDGLATYKGSYFLIAQPETGNEEAARVLLQALQNAIKS